MGETQTIREKPILFSSPMVRAILSGAKTQTRSVIKPQPAVTPELAELLPEAFATGHVYVKCPYGKVGDRLWVREAWRTGVNLNEDNASQIATMATDAGYEPGCPIWYEADGFHRQWADDDVDYFGLPGRYRHARFMPRWASRITLEITDVRVGRLTDISGADAIAEGLPLESPATASSAVMAYAELWESINGAGSWERNEWVWAVSVRRLP